MALAWLPMHHNDTADQRCWVSKSRLSLLHLQPSQQYPSSLGWMESPSLGWMVQQPLLQQQAQPPYWQEHHPFWGLKVSMCLQQHCLGLWHCHCQWQSLQCLSLPSWSPSSGSLKAYSPRFWRVCHLPLHSRPRALRDLGSLPSLLQLLHESTHKIRADMTSIWAGDRPDFVGSLKCRRQVCNAFYWTWQNTIWSTDGLPRQDPKKSENTRTQVRLACSALLECNFIFGLWTLGCICSQLLSLLGLC